MRVHLENLEISWNFVKFNKYHVQDDMQPGKTLWLLYIHPRLPDLEALVFSLMINFQKDFQLHMVGMNIVLANLLYFILYLLLCT